jgi:NAD(P)-dependent dehydrogenase (short-subunit alcohol dehydrogenase family)
MGRVQGKAAVVTGGALGIGRAACFLLAREGAQVAVTDVQEAPGRQTAVEIAKNGCSAEFWHLDVSQEAEVEQVFREVSSRFGRIDVLVNNAGIAGVDKPTHEVTEAEWDRLMAVNVKGTFFCTKHAIPYMRANGGGSIVNLSSIAGIVGVGNLPPYHASKGAIRLMSKNDALLYARDKIRVNSVHPGYIWTPMVEKLGAGTPQAVQAFRKSLDSKHPLGHVGEPDDIAWGILYLASDESKFVTGAQLVIDGGYTAQ